MHHLSELFMAKQKDWLSFVIENTALILDIRWQLKSQIKMIINSLTLNVTPEYMKNIGFKFPNVKFNFNYL